MFLKQQKLKAEGREHIASLIATSYSLDDIQKRISGRAPNKGRGGG